MELGLSLGEAPPAKSFAPAWKRGPAGGGELRLGFCAGFGGERETAAAEEENEERAEERGRWRPSVDPPVQLDLLPFSPITRPPSSSSSPPKLDFPWPLAANGSSDWSYRGLDVNQAPSAAEMEAAALVAVSSSPNSAVSSFQVDLSGAIAGSGGGGSRNDSGDADRACSRASDEEENGPTRKKLRLSKEQSAYLEESFREHNTLNPKQKVALAKQLNLRPRQVEVWFQNRRARTKLKQTEVDCEYLKSCCERLTEENRRLHKELQELRALKTSHPFYMQLPATTLTMCPSCERVATASTAACSSSAAAGGRSATVPAGGAAGKPLSSFDLRPSLPMLTTPRSVSAPQQHPPAAAHQSAAS